MGRAGRLIALPIAGVAAGALIVSVVLLLPHLASASGGATAVQAGGAHSCALMSDGGVTCWGENGSGQLGNSTTVEMHTPGVVCETGPPIAGVTSGAPSCCPVVMLGAPAGIIIQPCTPLTGVAAVATGDAHTCALMQDGTVKCWGDNGSGQLGHGPALNSPLPANVCASGPIILGSAGTPGARIPLCGPLSSVATIAAGDAHTCALLDNGTVKCWGANASGQLGNGFNSDSSFPVTVCAQPVILG